MKEQTFLPYTYCLDVEASGFGPQSYPIEIGVTHVQTREMRSWLIHPTDEWLENGFWSAESAAIHHIPLDLLLHEGIPAADVAAAVIAFCGNGIVLSDAVKYDSRWLARLWEAAGFPAPPFELDSFYAHVDARANNRFADPPIALAAAQEEALKRIPKRHRAGPDAARNAEILRLLTDNFFCEKETIRE